jgi:hypothetical protein
MTDQQHDDFALRAVELEGRHVRLVVNTRYEVCAKQPVTSRDSKLLKACGRPGFEEAIRAALADTGVRFDIDSGLSAGDAVSQLRLLNSSDRTEHTLTFAEADLKVNLLEFWASWCGPAYESLQQHQEMLERHPEWRDRVEVTAISTDEGTEAQDIIMKEYGWTNLTSCWVGQDSDNASKLFTVQTLPFTVLVHKGQVIWKGPHAKRMLEGDISGLIEGLPLRELDEEGESSKQPTEEEFEEKCSRVKAALEAFSEEYPHIATPKLAYTATKTYRPGKPVHYKFRAVLIGNVLEKHAERAEALVRDVASHFPVLENQVKQAKTYPIKRAGSCSRCLNTLTELDVQYLSLFEANFALCEACEATPGEGLGSASLAHPYSMYRVHPEADKLDEVVNSSKTLKRDKIYEAEPERNHETCMCDNTSAGCAGAIIGVRWKCAHCRDFDYCDACHTKWVAEYDAAMSEAAARSSHYPWHVFIKRVFP